jgi:hypothetical protein
MTRILRLHSAKKRAELRSGCFTLSGSWQRSRFVWSSLWLFRDDGAERTNVHTDLAVIAAIAHLQSRIEQEQGILPTNGYAYSADVADFRLEGDHEGPRLPSVYTCCQLGGREGGRSAARLLGAISIAETYAA